VTRRELSGLNVKQARNISPNLKHQFLGDRYGPLLSGKDLWSALGFKNSSAFRKAKSEGRLGVKVFSIPNRRGSYAYTKDVSAWLSNLNSEDKI